MMGAKLSLSQQRLGRIRDCHYNLSHPYYVSDALLQTFTRRVQRARTYVLHHHPDLGAEIYNEVDHIRVMRVRVVHGRD